MHRKANIFKLMVLTILMLLIYGVVDAQAPGTFTSTPFVPAPGGTVDVTPVLVTAKGATATNPATDVTFQDNLVLTGNAVQINSIAWEDGNGNVVNSSIASTPITFALQNSGGGSVAGVPPTWDLSASNGTNTLKAIFTCHGTINNTPTNQDLFRVLVVNTNSPSSGSIYRYRVGCRVDAAVYTARNSTDTTPAPPTVAMPLTQPNLFDTDAPLNETVLVIKNTGGSASSMQVNLSLSNTTGQLSLTSGSPINLTGGNGAEVKVTCTPTTTAPTYPATFTETLTVTHNAPDGGTPTHIESYQITCTVKGTSTYFSQTNTGSNAVNGTGLIDLGAVIVGQPYTADDALLIRNDGNGTLKITGMSIVGDPNNPNPPFAVTPGTPNDVFTVTTSSTFDLAPDGSMFVGIKCTPVTITNPGDPYVATLTVNYQDAAKGTTGVATYRLECDGTEQRPIYSATYNGQPLTSPDGLILMGDVPTNGSSTVNIIIKNTGPAFLTLQGVTPSANPIYQPDKFSFSGGVQSIAPNSQGTFSITCTPNGQSGLMQLQFTINHNPDNLNQVGKTYVVRCNGLAGAPVYQSNPAVGSSIQVLAGTSGTQLVITNAQTVGNSTLDVKAPSYTGTQGIFQFAVSGGFPFSLAPQESRTVTITCATTSDITNVTASFPYGTANSANYQLSCLQNGGTNNGGTNNGGTNNGGTNNGGTGNAPLYASNPGVGSTISISAPLSATGTQSITITNNGTADLVISSLSLSGTNAALFSVPSLGSQNTLPAGQSGELEIGCQASTAGTYTAVLTVSHNATGSPATYNLSCVVSNVTATPSGTLTATALPPVTGTAIAECPDGQVLSTPFPQNAAGEFLLVNCFIISQAGTVNISLAQLLASPATGVTDAEKAQISTNAGLLSVWRMGSWFLTESTYNAATQTYSFQSAAGTNIYAFFYGAITRPVGSQGFAGTTTGNVKDVEIKDDNTSPIAALIATVLVIFLLGIFLSRRFRNVEEAAA